MGCSADGGCRLLRSVQTHVTLKEGDRRVSLGFLRQRGSRWVVEGPQQGDQLVTKSLQIAPSPPVGSERPANTSINSLVGWHGDSRTRSARRRQRSATPNGSFASFEATFIGEQAVLTVWG